VTNGSMGEFGPSITWDAKCKHGVPIPFRADEVGYFDPDLDESHGDRDMVTIGKGLWFRDVFLFTDGLKDVLIRKEESVQINLTS
jgi:hypothetical protein